MNSFEWIWQYAKNKNKLLLAVILSLLTLF